MYHRHYVALMALECSGYHCLAHLRFILRLKCLSEMLNNLKSISKYALLHIGQKKNCYFKKWFMTIVSNNFEQPSYIFNIFYYGDDNWIPREEREGWQIFLDGLFIFSTGSVEIFISNYTEAKVFFK